MLCYEFQIATKCEKLEYLEVFALTYVEYFSGHFGSQLTKIINKWKREKTHFVKDSLSTIERLLLFFMSIHSSLYLQSFSAGPVG